MLMKDCKITPKPLTAAKCRELIEAVEACYKPTISVSEWIRPKKDGLITRFLRRRGLLRRRVNA